MPSPFEELLNDLAAVQALRTTQTPQRDTVSRIARHAAEAQRNRRMTRPQPQRRLAKAAPLPDYRAPDWDSLSARQDKIAAEMEQTRIEQQQNAIRAHLSVLRQAAQAGRLTAHQACLLDVYRGQAAALGLQP